jgi:hypothetical protein
LQASRTTPGCWLSPSQPSAVTVTDRMVECRISHVDAEMLQPRAAGWGEYLLAVEETRSAAHFDTARSILGVPGLIVNGEPITRGRNS